MTYESTLALAEGYLRKHIVPEAEFGLAHTIETDDWMFLADPRVPDRRMQLTLAHTGSYNDCLSIAERLYLDISSRNPELGPAMAMSTGADVHNWVQIRDPETREMAQIDATPWFARLNPGHDGAEWQYEPLPMLVQLMMIPFSVRKTRHDRFITVGLEGILPRCRDAAEKDGPAAGEDGPLFSFIFQIRKDLGFGTKPEQAMHVFIDVLDIDRLHGSLKSKGSMDDLIAARAIRAGFTAFSDEGTAFLALSSMGAMHQAAGQTRDTELFAEFDRSVPTILKLLSGAGSPLPIAGRLDQELDVANGRINASDGRKYRDFIRLLDRKLQEPRKRIRTG